MKFARKSSESLKIEEGTLHRDCFGRELAVLILAITLLDGPSGRNELHCTTPDSRSISKQTVTHEEDTIQKSTTCLSTSQNPRCKSINERKTDECAFQPYITSQQQTHEFTNERAVLSGSRKKKEMTTAQSPARKDSRGPETDMACWLTRSILLSFLHTNKARCPTCHIKHTYQPRQSQNKQNMATYKTCTSTIICELPKQKNCINVPSLATTFLYPSGLDLYVYDSG